WDAKIAGQHFKMIQNDVLAARRDFPEAVRELRIGYQSMGALDLYDAAAVRAHVASAVGKLEALATTGPTRRVTLRGFLSHAASDEPLARHLRLALEAGAPGVTYFQASHRGHIPPGDSWCGPILDALRGA